MRKISYILIPVLSLFSQQLFAQLYVTGSATINCQNSPAVYIKGDLNNTGTINLGDADVYITKNWTNTGTVSEGTSSVIFDGTSNQMLTSGGDRFYNLAVNKSTGGGDMLTLGDNAEVSNVLTFTDGMLSTTTSYKMDLGTTGAVSGEANGQYVRGELTATRTVNANSSTFGGMGVSVDASANTQNLGVVTVSRKAGTATAGYSYLQNGTDVTLDLVVDIQAQNAATQNVNLGLTWLSDWDNSIDINTVRGWNSTDGGTNWTTNGSTYSGASRSVSFMDMALEKWTIASDSACFATPPIANGGADKATCVSSAAKLSPNGVGTWSGGLGTFLGDEYQPALSEAGTTVTLTWTVANIGHCPSVKDFVDVAVSAVPPSPTIAASMDTVCAGTIITLSATPPLGYSSVEYLWSKNGTPVNYQNGGAGTYTVNVGQASGTINYDVEIVYTGFNCLSNSSANISVVVLSPVANITPAGPTAFCAGTPTVLNATPGMATYVWEKGAVVVGTNSPSYTPTSSGNYSVVVTDAKGCSKSSSWVNIVVSPSPAANAGIDKNVCQGAAVSIGSANNVANTYTWSPATGLNNIYVSNPTSSATATTTYTLTVRNAGNCTTTDQVIVTSLPAPAEPSLSSTATPVCQGSTITITPNSSGANSINWYRNGLLIYNKPITNGVNITAATPSSNDYTIKSKGANGCLSTTSNTIAAWVKEAATPTISSVPAAVGSTITVCVPGGTSGSATLTANTTTASPTYSWRLAGAYISGANNNTYTQIVTTASNNKILSVEANYANGCKKISANRNVKLVTTGCTPKMGEGKGGDELSNMSVESQILSAYPNPTNGLLNIDIQNCASSVGKLVLYNTLGQIVAERNLAIVNGSAIETIDLREMAIGVYSLSFQTEDHQITQKVVKE